MSLTVLRCTLYCSGPELNLQRLQGVPVYDNSIPSNKLDPNTLTALKIKLQNTQMVLAFVQGPVPFGCLWLLSALHLCSQSRSLPQQNGKPPDANIVLISTSRQGTF